jgi:hypothetical protein
VNDDLRNWHFFISENRVSFVKYFDAISNLDAWFLYDYGIYKNGGVLVLPFIGSYSDKVALPDEFDFITDIESGLLSRIENIIFNKI